MAVILVLPLWYLLYPPYIAYVNTIFTLNMEFSTIFGKYAKIRERTKMPELPEVETVRRELEKRKSNFKCISGWRCYV